MGTSTLTAPETRAPTGHIITDFELLADAALLDDKQLGELIGRKRSTIKKWRSLGFMRGPEFITIHGRPPVSVGAVRAWLAGLPAGMNTRY